MNDTEIALLVCDCGGSNAATLDGLSSSGLDADAYVIRDLCGAALAKPVELAAIMKSYRRVIVLACYPRAVRALLAQCGVDSPSVEFVNLLDGGLAAAVAVAYGLGVGAGTTRVRSLDSGLPVPSWFPVIDRARCTGCGKCADFCLFGVYRKAAGKKPEVVKPLNCKNNCPACARKCPNQAVLFPKIAERGTIAGAEVGTSRLEAELTEASSTRRGETPRARSSLLRPGVIEGIERGRLLALREREQEEALPND